MRQPGGDAAASVELSGGEDGDHSVARYGPVGGDDGVGRDATGWEAVEDEPVSCQCDRALERLLQPLMSELSGQEQAVKLTQRGGS